MFTEIEKDIMFNCLVNLQIRIEEDIELEKSGHVIYKKGVLKRQLKEVNSLISSLEKHKG